MKPFVDGNKVFVAADDFVNLQESDAVFGTCHEFCVAAVVASTKEGLKKHISYISPDDLNECIGLKAGGKVPKVTIEWVDEKETFPEAGSPGYDAFMAGRGGVSRIETIPAG